MTISRDEKPDASLPAPAPDDLAGWKQADRTLCTNIARSVIESNLFAWKPFERFFGDADLAMEVFDRRRTDPTQAVLEWVFAHYPPAKRSPTLLSRMLDTEITEAHRALLLGRKEGNVAIYRVAAIDKGLSASVVDVTTGANDTIHDRLFSESARPHMVFAAKLHRVGNFTFMTALSPAFPPPRADEVIRFLEDEGAGAGLAGLAARGHLVGRLWKLADEMSNEPDELPDLSNTDGDVLELHDGVFEVSDPGRLRRALLARNDIDHDEVDDSFTWFRDDSRSSTALAGLQILDHELLVFANSAPRFKAVRTWLQALQGVRFVKVKRTDPKDAVEHRREAPLDDRLRDTTPPAPQDLRILREAIENDAIEWLDRKIPMFGGKTPRELCKTAQGRARVRTFINTWAPPTNSYGVQIDIPRDRMLRALGLDSDDAAAHG